MRKMKIFVVVYAVFFSLLNVNKSDGQESASPNVLNIIVILDTSDRVSPEKHPNQEKHDIRIVKEIVTQFEKVVEKHILQADELAYEDSLTIVVPNQPGVPSVSWEIMEKLTIEDPEGHVSLKGNSGILTELEKQKKALLDAMPQLYEEVVQNSQTGSDIWEWFKYEAEDYFGKNKRNLIICLSDGYLNFDRSIEARRREGTFMKISELRDDPNWKQRILDGEGLSPIGEDFSPFNVKFLMGEITLQGDSSGIPYQQDFDIIKEYWKTWLNSMGIQDIDFRKRLSLQRIKSFISGEDGS